MSCFPRVQPSMLYLFDPFLPQRRAQKMVAGDFFYLTLKVKFADLHLSLEY